MYYEPTTNTLWLYSTKQIFQIIIENEDRDVWVSYLETEEYQKALDFCENKGLEKERKKVSRIYAQSLFDQGEYITSAFFYGKSDERFEDVTLKFLMVNNLDALKSFFFINLSLSSNNRREIQKRRLYTAKFNFYMASRYLPS